MKLIDILAREMNEWPNDARSVTQLADGRLYHGGDGGCRGEIFYARAIDWIHAVVTREQWEEARGELKEHRQWLKQMGIPDGWTYLSDPDFNPEWRGPQDGLPPIGTEVQVVACDGKPLTYGEGESGPVVAHVENTAVVRMSYGLGCFEADVLKPLKSDRDRWIEQACEAVEAEAPEININIDCSYAIRKTIEVIHDSGLANLKPEKGTIRMIKATDTRDGEMKLFCLSSKGMSAVLRTFAREWMTAEPYSRTPAICWTAIEYDRIGDDAVLLWEEVE